MSEYPEVTEKEFMPHAPGDSSCRNKRPVGWRSVRTLTRVSLRLGVAWRTCNTSILIQSQTIKAKGLKELTLQAMIRSKDSGSNPWARGSFEISRTANSIPA